MTLHQFAVTLPSLVLIESHSYFRLDAIDKTLVGISNNIDTITATLDLATKIADAEIKNTVITSLGVA